MKFKYYVTVPKEYLKLNKYELLIMTHLYESKFIGKELAILTTFALVEEYNINTDKKRRAIVRAFNSLIEKNIISVTKKNNSWIVDLNKIEPKERYFFRVYISDMNKIFKDGNINLFKYYCIIMSSLNSKTRKARIPITMLSEQCNFSKMTIMRYNKILEDMKILDISHGNYLNCNIYRNCNEYELKNNWDSAPEKFEELPAV